MKAYFIFVLVLTVAYIVYYAVMITKDLHGNGEKKKSEEEEFDVSEFDAEESVSVVENDKGFNVGDNEYETHYVDETQSVSDDKEPESESTSRMWLKQSTTGLRKKWKRHMPLSPTLTIPQSYTN